MLRNNVGTVGPASVRPTTNQTPVSVGALRDGAVLRSVTLTPGRTITVLISHSLPLSLGQGTLPIAPMAPPFRSAAAPHPGCRSLRSGAPLPRASGSDRPNPLASG